MKSRVIILISVVFCAIGLVALALNAASIITSEQDPAELSNLDQDRLSIPLPVIAPVPGDLLKPPANDSPDRAIQVSSGSSKAIAMRDTDIPWRPPEQSQPALGAGRPAQDQPAEPPSRPRHKTSGANAPASISSPAERASEQASIGSPVERASEQESSWASTISPVGNLSGDGRAWGAGGAGPQAYDPPAAGVNVDMAYDVLFGYMDPGDLVTATALSGNVYGAAYADGVGFFFTNLWGTDGRQVDLVGGETIDVYLNGVFLKSITLPTFNGDIRVDEDQVVGSVSDLSSGDILTTSLGIWGWEPTDETPWATASLDGSGNFAADFSADLGPHNLARVEVKVGDGRVYYYAYPTDVFNVDTYSYIFGYGQPYQTVTVTVYVGNSSDVRGSQTVMGNWPHGDYTAELLVEPGDTVEVDLGGGNVLTMQAGLLTANIDLVADQVTGQAPALTPVRLFLYEWMRGSYQEISTTADASGNYIATFPSYDLTSKDSIYPAYADGSGSEVLLSVFPARIVAYLDWDGIGGVGDAPFVPFTYTVNHEGVDYSIQGETNAVNGTGFIDFGAMGVDVAPGDLVTLQTATWKDSMVVADLTLTADTAGDAYVGSVDQPGEVLVVSFPWPGPYPVFKMASGMATASSSFSISPPGQDVRGGMNGRVLHYDLNGNATRKDFEVRYFGLDLPWGLSSPQYDPAEVITATLYESDQTTVKRQVSTDNDWNPDWYWLEFDGQIATGDWMHVTNGSDWDTWLEVPELSIWVDPQNDLITGIGPQGQLYLDGGRSDWYFGFWLPTYDDGTGQGYLADTSDYFDMEFGSWANVYYQNLDGNQARSYFNFPDLTARYNPDGSSSVFGSNAILGNTIVITVTNPLDEVVASGTTEAGSGDWGPQSFWLDFPDYGLTPGDLIHMDFGSGFTDTLPIEELTAQADKDSDLVTGVGPADGWLNAWISNPFGDNLGLEQVQISSSGDYTLDFGAAGWDINNGDDIHVYYQAWHRHQIERFIYLPRPELGLSIYNTSGGAHPGGPYSFGVWLSNDEGLAAQDVQVVMTLPPDTSWAGDTFGVTPQIGANGVITWNLGTLAPWEQTNHYVTVQLDPAHPTGDGALGAMCGNVSTSTYGDTDPGNDSSCSGNTGVQDEDIDIRVDKWPDPGDVVAGQEFVYQIQYCNDRFSAAGPVWLTDTLPVSTTFVSVEPRGWWGQVYWSEQTLAGGELQLYFPSFPGQSCLDIGLRLLADPALPFGTVLSNRVEVATAGDTNPDGNVRVNEDARIGTPRADLNLVKTFDNGILTPGGELYYKLDYYNRGNIAVSGRLTDTLPAGTAYVEGSAYDYNGQPIDPVLVAGNEMVWDVGEIGVSWGFGLSYRLRILESTAPGTVLVNCATIGHNAEEDTPDNNTACDERTVYEHGPNLQVEKYHEWYGDGWLHYEITLRNLGDETVYSPVVTDTYPLSTTYAGWGHDFWEGIELTEDPDNHRLSWQLNRLEPGWGTRIRFEAPLDNPGQPLIWYTNLVEISATEGEINPADNTYTDVAFSGGEVERVEMWVGTDHSGLWGSAQPGSTVSVENRGEIYTAYADPGCDGCWDIGDIGPLWPGDTFTVTAGAGLQPVVVHVPAPFDVSGDSHTDTVSGQLGVPADSWLRVELYGVSGKDVQVDDAGFYAATFNDIPRGGEGHIRYETTMDYAQTVFHRRYRSPDLIMSANYAHDWVQGRYEVGHTVWITVTESDGVTERAHAQVQTYNIPWWNGDPGFEPQGDEWVPGQPDIQEGDWVFGRLDNGYTTTIQIGSITGLVDDVNDRIEGTVLAGWIPQPVEVRCHTWGSPNNAPQKQDIVLPDGVDNYSCAWDPVSEWDVLGGQQIGVEYYEPDGDSVFNVFQAPSPDLQVQNYSHGNAGEGGNLQLQVQYANQGNLDSYSVVITQTLEGMQYLSDTSGYPVTTGTTPGGDPYIVYDLGTLLPGDWINFDVFVQVTEPASQMITSTVQIAGAPDGGDLNNKINTWSGQVQSNNTHLNLGKGPWTGDPTPGGQFVWAVNACNNGGTGSSQLVLTDTLPSHMTLLNWWGQHSGWTEVARNATQLVVTRPTLPQGWCSQVFLRFLVDADVPVNTNVENIAQVWAANDIETNDNQTNSWVNINNPHINLRIDQWWGGGSLVPGGTFRYHMEYQNTGNVPVDGAIITDTLPVDTSLDYIMRFDRDWHFIEYMSPTIVGNQVVWSLGPMENGEVGYFEVSVTVDQDAVPGTDLENRVDISQLPDEDTYNDNTAVWVETLHDHGPNLRLTKDQWCGGSQYCYQINFANVGDQTVSGAWITDTLPENTQWDGWWDMGFDWNRVVSTDLTPGMLRWQFSDIYPGDSGWLRYNVVLDDPNARPRTYTNNAQIGPLAGDSYEGDNFASTSVTLGEVERVEMWVSQGSYGMWGQAQPGATVTVTKGTEQFTGWADPGCGGCWNIGNVPPLLPGETLTVTAGAGLLPVVITAPNPFSVWADSNTNTVWGQIDSLNREWLDVNLYGYYGMGIQTDETGNFTAAYPDIPPAGNGDVRYETTINDAIVDFHYRFQAEDLLLRVNYGHDWLQAIYPVGHTVWITVTNSLGEEKATYEAITSVGGAWGSDGYETQGHLWSPNQPNIEEGDWIRARSDDGKTAEVHIGTITGDLNLDTDRINGTITAPFVSSLRMTCDLWVDSGPPQIVGSVDPLGGSYECNWAGVYDLQPDQNVAVSYYEPGGHQIINVFSVGRPSLNILKWADGTPGVGGNFIFHISYSNNGNGPAENVLITDTLLAGMTYLSDTTPFPLVSSDPLVWDLGSLPNGDQGSFDLTVHIDAPAGTDLTNTAQIDTSSPWDSSLPENKVSQWTGTVQPNATDVSINMWSLAGNPAPGYQFTYQTQACNWGTTNSAEVTLTATLPVSLTLVDWWDMSSGWAEYSRTDHELVLKRSSIATYQCNDVQLAVEMDAGVPLGTQLTASARVDSSNDVNTGNNETSTTVNADSPLTNLSITKSWSGWPVPGGQLVYSLNFWGGGNVRPQGLLITDTFPAGTTFAWANPGSDVTMVDSGLGYAVWQVSRTVNNFSNGFAVALNIDPSAAPGSILTNTVEIGVLGAFPEETSILDNTSQAVVTLNPAGPNLKVSKTRSLEGQNVLRYNILFENLGSETINDVEILDTLPSGTTYSGMWTYYFDWNRFQGMDDLGTALRWRLSSLYPGDVGSIDIYLNLNDPNARPAWYNNTVQITTPDGDTNPADNTYLDEFLLGEVTSVDLQVGVEHAWINGYAALNSNVSVQTSSDLYPTQANGWDGNWGIGDIGSVRPGDVITVTAGNGSLPVVIQVPDPFDAQADSSLGQVWGQIGGSAGQAVRVEGGWFDGIRLLTADVSGAYTATYGYFPAGSQGEVRYAQTIDQAAVTFHHPFRDPYVNLGVSKFGLSTPTPGGNYVYQINYANDSGDLASNVVLTDTLPAGTTYLSDTSGYPAFLVGNQVVWHIGSLGNANNNFQMVVAVDPGLPPETELVNTIQIATITPEWNYGDNSYQAVNAVTGNNTHLNIALGPSLGDPAPGSHYSYWFNVCNNGSTASSSVILTATLPVSTTLISWDGSMWSEVSFDGQELVLSYPSVSGGSCTSGNLNVLLDGDAPNGLLLEASAVISARNDLETEDNQSTCQQTVSAPHIDQWVYKTPEGGMLVPGSTLTFRIQYGYDANFAPGSLTITDTLPVSTTFVEAWRNGPFGPEYFSPDATGEGYVVFDFAGMVANSYGGDFYVNLHVDEEAAPDLQLVNTAEIQPHPVESYLENNQSSWTGTLQSHHTDLQAQTGGGWDWANNQADLWTSVTNAGDQAAGVFTITVTYPDSMSVAEPPSGSDMTGWQDYPALHYFTATVSHLNSFTSMQLNFSMQMQGGGAIPGGQAFDFITDVSVPLDDVDPGNNHASLTLYTGPDLFVEKTMTDGYLVPGGWVVYRLHLGNRYYPGYYTLQGNVVLTDTLPAGLTYTSDSWGSGQVNGQTIVWDLGQPSVGWEDDVYVYADIGSAAHIGDGFTNNALISLTDPADVEIYPSDNTSSHTFQIVMPEFAISKQVEGSLVAGTLVTYTLTVTNNGNATDTNLQVYDLVPSNLSYLASDGWWDGSQVYWTIAQLEPQHSAQVWFSAILPSSAGVEITNQDYRVVGSDLGFSSPPGSALSFIALEPTIVPSFDQSASSVLVGTTVAFTDTSTTDGLPIVNWAWDPGEGGWQYGVPQLSHTYNTPGDYPVTLVVTDSLGYSASTSSLVHVELPPTEPHFQGCAFNTGGNATVVVPSGVTIIEGLVLEAGDEIAIYNNGNNLCAGVRTWTGGNLAITAWGDDEMTPEVDGLLSGETMHYRIWDASEGIEYNNVTASYTQGTGIYTSPSFHVVGVLDLNLPDVQEINLNAGWNMISSFVDPLYPSMEDVFSEIVADVVVVKNGLGLVYWPAWEINDIGNWNVLDGYQVYMTAARTLTITGTQVIPENTPINMATGWRMVSYLRDNPMNVDTALSSLGGSLFLAKNGLGQVYWPEWGINDIVNMLPGQGYQLYLTAPGTLTYPSNAMASPVEQGAASPPSLKHFNACAAGTDSNATLLLPPGTPRLGLPAGVSLQAGDELAAFGAQSGVCAGALTWDGPFSAQALTLWGDDEITPAVDGLQPGEAQTWVLWRHATGEEMQVSVSYSQAAPYQGDGAYVDGGLYRLETPPQYWLFLPLMR